MKLNDPEMYKVSMEIGDLTREIVNSFPWIAKDTIGKQWIKVADSIAANRSEGEGSYYCGDKIRYLYYSRASLFESNTWLEKSFSGELVSEETCDKMELLLDKALKMINGNLKYQKARKT